MQKNSTAFDRRLTEAEYNYVLFHLSMHVDEQTDLSTVIRYGDARSMGVFVPSTENEVVFPTKDAADLYADDEQGVVFNCDIIKSAFCLLSGYCQNEGHVPLVNYYFRWLLDACEEYCMANNVHFARRDMFERPVLHIAHGIDRVRYYTFRRAFCRLAQAAGLRPCDTSRGRMAKSAFRTLTNLLGLTRHPNPWWSFDEMMGVERYYGFRSTWYLSVHGDNGHIVDYNRNDADIQALVGQIKASGGEVADAGPMGNLDIEGFQNGYCLPFHPFDHEHQQMMSHWEIPHSFVDVAVLQHHHDNYDEIYDVIGDMLEEVREFNGVFSFLWHNSTFDETYYFGVQKFYEELHYFFTQYQMKCFTSKEIEKSIHI